MGILKPYWKELKSKLLLFSVFLFLGGAALGQATDREFADHYYAQGEFEKATLYYEKLYDQAKSEVYYQKLFTCYLNIERLEDAEKLSKKHLRKSANPYLIYLDLAKIQLQLKEENKAKKYFENALEEVPMRRGNLQNLARELLKISQYTLAERVYRMGQEDPKIRYDFNLELASLYGEQGNTEEMINQYLSLVENNRAYQQSVKNAFSRYLNFTEREEESELLRKSLLRITQKNPENTTLSELMIWYFYQVKNFRGAWIQIKALDKRLQETGNRVIEFAQTCLSNEEFELAMDAFNYLLEGNRTELREYFLGERAKAAFLYLESSPTATQEFIDDTKSILKEAIDEVPLVKNPHTHLVWADFLLKYDHTPDSAAAVLQKIIATPQIYEKIQAHAKLALADIFIITGDIWEASLLYSQVDKAFKEDALGTEAKYRNARIAYFTGDFEWAQAQLDILKASTYEYISNDAMDLSLVITDNFNLDTILEPMQLYAQAELFTFQKKYEDAITTLDSITTLYPGHSLSDEIWMEKYQIAYRLQQWDKAKEALEALENNFSYDIYGDDAIYLLGVMYEDIFNDPEKAMEYYKKLLLDYPASLFVIDARKRFRNLKGIEKFIN